MIYNTGFLISLQTIQQVLDSISVSIFGESPYLYLISIETFTAIRRFTLITAVQALIYSAPSDFAPFGIFTPLQFLKSVSPASLANNVL